MSLLHLIRKYHATKMKKKTHPAKIQRRQLMLAYVSIMALFNPKCSDAFGLVKIGEDNTCELDGCKKVKEVAIETLEKQIRRYYDPQCKDYIVALPMNECVRYDCHQLLD